MPAIGSAVIIQWVPVVVRRESIAKNSGEWNEVGVAQVDATKTTENSWAEPEVEVVLGPCGATQ